MEFSNAQQDKL